jgi:hypothetical protein
LDLLQILKRVFNPNSNMLAWLELKLERELTLTGSRLNIKLTDTLHSQRCFLLKTRCPGYQYFPRKEVQSLFAKKLLSNSESLLTLNTDSLNTPLLNAIFVTLALSSTFKSDHPNQIMVTHIKIWPFTSRSGKSH